ncbi:adenylate kinase family protein [Patescibacteria group bacterium]
MSKIKKKPVIFFLSKSGAGKDTQAEFLIKKYGYAYMNTGGLIRAVAKTKTYESREMHKIEKKGKFVPTLNVVCLWKVELMKIIKNYKRVKGIVFVGSPRKLSEAMLLRDFFLNWPDAVNFFKLVPMEVFISDKEVIKRLGARRQCENCSKFFSYFKEHMAFKVCDKCGGKLMRRKDDSVSGIKSRLKEYRNHVLPVIKYFKKIDKVIKINGEQSIEKVHKDINLALKNIL